MAHPSMSDRRSNSEKTDLYTESASAPPKNGQNTQVGLSPADKDSQSIPPAQDFCRSKNASNGTESFNRSFPGSNNEQLPTNEEDDEENRTVAQAPTNNVHSENGTGSDDTTKPVASQEKHPRAPNQEQLQELGAVGGQTAGQAEVQRPIGRNFPAAPKNQSLQTTRRKNSPGTKKKTTSSRKKAKREKKKARRCNNQLSPSTGESSSSQPGIENLTGEVAERTLPEENNGEVPASMGAAVPASEIDSTLRIESTYGASGFANSLSTGGFQLNPNEELEHPTNLPIQVTGCVRERREDHRFYTERVLSLDVAAFLFALSTLSERQEIFLDLSNVRPDWWPIFHRDEEPEEVFLHPDEQEDNEPLEISLRHDSNSKAF